MSGSMSWRSTFGSAVAVWGALLHVSALEAQSIDEICRGELLEFPLPPLRVFDGNHDETLDESEVERCDSLETMFSRLDLDANQRLDSAEYDAFAVLWTRHIRTFGGVESVAE